MRAKVALEKVLSYALPNHCAVCGRPITPFRLLCEDCFERLHSMGPVLKAERHRGYVLRYYSRYESPLSDVIVSYKSGRWRLAYVLVDLFERLFEKQPPSAGIIAPIPATEHSLHSKGYDHMGLLARILAKRLNRKLQRSLVVVRDLRQAGKSGNERKRLKGKFEAVGKVPKELILIDDVFTTGTTVENAIEVLEAGGAKKIEVYTLARS